MSTDQTDHFNMKGQLIKIRKMFKVIYERIKIYFITVPFLLKYILIYKTVIKWKDTHSICDRV